MLQQIKANSINSSPVFMAGRDLVVNNIEPLTNYPIYFIYGDSDVQLYIYKVGKCFSENSLYHDIEKALRLLLAFKPSSFCVVISPSSIIQSITTKILFENYSCFYTNTNKHIYVPRRELDWYDFFYKRMDNTKSLRKFERYSLYFDKNMQIFFKNIPAYLKTINTGISCSDVLIEETKSIVKRYDNKMSLVIHIEDSINNILRNSILVWEELENELNKITTSQNIINEMRRALIMSYSLTFKDSYLTPYNMTINNVNYVIDLDTRHYFLNLTLLDTIVKVSEIYVDFFKLTPKQLLKLINSESFYEYKYLLEKEGTEELKLLFNAKKHSKKIKSIIREL